MMTLLYNHYLVAVPTVPTVIPAITVSITVHLRTCTLLMAAVTLLMRAADHDRLCVGNRRRGENYEGCDH